MRLARLSAPLALATYYRPVVPPTVAREIEVCAVINSLGYGGAETLLVELVGELDDVSFTVASFGGDDSLADPLAAAGATVHDLGEAVRFDPRAARRLRRLLAAGDVDVVHAHLPYAQTVARLVARSVGDAAVVSTQHNAPRAYHPLVRTTERLTRPLEDVTVAVSQAVERACTGDAHPPGAVGDDWCTIHNGIDVAGFAELVRAADAGAVRTSLDVAPGASLVLGVGRYVPDKAQRDLVAGFAAADLGDAALVLVGHGPLEADLRASAREHGVADRVHVTGEVQDVHPYYAAADVFASASRVEGLPVTVLEAMAAGLPVAATDVPGTREAVADGETGRLVPYGDAAALATALEALAAPDPGDAYGDAGRDRARERFDVARMAADYRGLYRSLVA